MSRIAFSCKEEQSNETVSCNRYDWSIILSCDLDHVKAKQETPFPILKKRARVGKTVLALLAYLYGFLWCFDIKVLYVKLLTRLQIV